MKKLALIFISRLCYINILISQSFTHTIKVNQIGYLKDANKIAVINNVNSNLKFFIVSPELTIVLDSGILEGPFKSNYSPNTTYIADFSHFKKTGKYRLFIPEIGYSYIFEVNNNTYKNLANASLKAFYFFRSSTPLYYEYASIWARPSGHPDTSVYVHSSAASNTRTEESRISSPKGWYDAGDYNKYIVNSGITMWTLFSLYELYPEYFYNLTLNIPESKNNIPDLLDEILWNLRWMLTMQDPEDGGVYFKLTNTHFDAMIMPAEAKSKRYVIQKTTSSTLNFAAVMAQAARIFKKFNNALPGLADSCLKASLNAWNWAQKNPNIIYNQNELNKSYDPDIFTGGYEDNNLSDEFLWAAIEIMISTKNFKLIPLKNIYELNFIPYPSWNNVNALAYISLLRHEKIFPTTYKTKIENIKNLLKITADSMINMAKKHYYKTVMGTHLSDFVWGSNSIAANQGLILVEAYRIFKNEEYLKYALNNLNYLLGMNPIGYCYVTGFGYKNPKFIHHRPSVADEIFEPIPGTLVGGPNPHNEDKIPLTSYIPDEAYIDDDRAYAANEIAINWNAALAYLVNSINIIYNK